MEGQDVFMGVPLTVPTPFDGVSEIEDGIIFTIRAGAGLLTEKTG